MSEKEFNLHVETKISQILKAAQDYQNNPEKAKDYIIKTVSDISKASKEFGKSLITEELFFG